MRKIYDILEFLGKIDRRWIYLLVFIFAILPLALKLKVRVNPTEEVRKAYNYIENLKEGDRVLISIDYDPSSMPELQPMLYAILRHLFRKNLKVIMMGHWPLGLPLGKTALEEVAKEYNKKYGEDYVFLGFRPGGSAVMVAMGSEIRNVFAADQYGTPLDSLPVMKDVHNYDDIALLIGLEAGSTGDFWVQFANARFGQEIILGCTAVIAPNLYPYYQAGQIRGIIGGLRGAADYENLVGKLGTGSIGMWVQSAIHILIIIFIIFGNVGYFVLRKRRKRVG